MSWYVAYQLSKDQKLFFLSETMGLFNQTAKWNDIEIELSKFSTSGLIDNEAM